MMTSYNHFNEEDRYMIIETTRMLLAAGSRTDGPVYKEPLDFLVKILLSITTYRYFLHLSRLNNHYLLIVKLFQLLLTHGAKARTELYFLFLYRAGTIASDFNE